MTLLLIIVAALGGAVGFYFFLRANPKKSAVVDKAANSVAAKLK